jgi:hypothetical protein
MNPNNPRHMFTILDDTNTARVTLNNNLTGHSQTVETLADNAAIRLAGVNFAGAQKIHFKNVGFSIIWPEAKARKIQERYLAEGILEDGDSSKEACEEL